MKITKNELRTVIREELQKLQEGARTDITVIQRKNRVEIHFISTEAQTFYTKNASKYGFPTTPVLYRDYSWLVVYPRKPDTLSNIEKWIKNKVKLSYEVLKDG